jgi:hypothetical protein
MAAACVELKGLNPRLDITTETSEHDAYYIKYKNPQYEAMHLENADSVYRAADSVYVHPARLMKQLFTDSAYVRKYIKDASGLMADYSNYTVLAKAVTISRICRSCLPNRNAMIFGNGTILSGIMRKVLLR